MSEQAKMEFTKGADQTTYVSEEVDSYLAMLHGAYEEMANELNEVKATSSVDKKSFDEVSKSLAEEKAKSAIDKKSFDEVSKLLKEEKEKAAKGKQSFDEVNQSLKDEKAQALSELEKMKQLVAELEKAASEVPDIEGMKKSYESQIKNLEDKLDIEQIARGKADGERSKLQKEKEDNLKTITELKQVKEAMKKASEAEEFHEKKVKLLEELAARNREEVNNLQKEKEVLAIAKKQLEEEQLRNTQDGRTKIHNELFERATDTVEGYVNETNEQMKNLLSKTKEEQDELLNRAQVESFNIVRTAKTEAEEMLEQARQESQEVLAKTQEEYCKIRELIGQASMEYAQMATSMNATKVEKIVKDKSAEDKPTKVKSLEKNGDKG